MTNCGLTLDLSPAQRDFPSGLIRSQISDALPSGELSYAGPDAVSNAVGYAKFRSRSHDAVIRIYDAAGNVIDTHEHTGDFKEW